MPTLELTAQDLKNYRKGQKKHVFYDRSCQLAAEIAVHADGSFPDGLLRNRRPNEPLAVFNYRKEIFVAVTKPAFSKVFSSLQKIRRSGDWNIDYGDREEEYDKIQPDEQLSDYCEKEFPYFASVTNWTFNLELRKYLIDPNAVLMVMPLDINAEINVYKRPFPVIFDSHNVVDYKEEDYCVLKNPAGAYYTASGNNLVQGESYYFVTTERIQRWDQVDGKFNFDLVVDFVHELGFMPAQKLGGVIIDQADDQFLFESRITPMVPELNEAIREYSDLQAAKVLHIYPERWEFGNTECPTCQGKARIVNPRWTDDCTDCGPQWETCDGCGGTGIYKNRGPYEKMIVRPNNTSVGETGNVPIPPGGFLEKDVEIVKIQDQGVTDHIYRAFAAINFEFLANTPLSQSGTAKEVDKDELNNTVNSFAEDLVKTMDFVYRCIANYRYGFQYGYAGEVNDMLPKIAVPVSYDLLGNYNAQNTLVNARAAGANPVILSALEAEYASKVFYSNPEVKKQLLLEINLDPMPNIAQSDKILMLTNKGIDQLTYVVSSNIHGFIQRALDEDPKFVNLDASEQREVLQGYAQELIDANTAKAKIARLPFNPSQNGLIVGADGLITPGEENDPNVNGGSAVRLNNNQVIPQIGNVPGYTGSNNQIIN